MRRPSAIIMTGSEGAVATRVSPAPSMRSLYSPAVWDTNVQQFRGAGTISRLPEDAFEASTRSSIRRFSLSDCLTTTSEYSRIFGSAGSQVPMSEA